MSQKSL